MRIVCEDGDRDESDRLCKMKKEREKGGGMRGLKQNYVKN